MNVETFKRALAGIDNFYIDILVKKNKDLLLKCLNQLPPNGSVAPHLHLLFNAFRYCPPDKLKCVIIGQDPYPNTVDAEGMSFSVSNEVTTPAPKSLQKIHSCLRYNNLLFGAEKKSLIPWAQQGVLLLNAMLTVGINPVAKHEFWEVYTNKIITDLCVCKPDLIWILWGDYAKKKSNIITSGNILSWGHPSPASPKNSDPKNPENFIYCDNFIKANQILLAKNKESINWGAIGEDKKNDNSTITSLVTIPQTPQVTTTQVTLAQTPQVTIPQTPQVTTTQVTLVQTPQVTLVQTPQVTLAQTPQVSTTQTPQVTLAQTPQVSTLKTVIAATDGAASSNGKANCLASWGFIIERHENDNISLVQNYGMVPLIDIPGKKYKTSNNRGELMAILKCIETIESMYKNSNINVISDNEYSINCIVNWANEWIKKGIFDEKENTDLIHPILNILAKTNNKYLFEHIPSHTTEPDKNSPIYIKWQYNDMADLVCDKAFTDVGLTPPTKGGNRKKPMMTEQSIKTPTGGRSPSKSASTHTQNITSIHDAFLSESKLESINDQLIKPTSLTKPVRKTKKTIIKSSTREVQSIDIKNPNL